MILRFQG